jgi:hypothetical protein
MGRKAAGELNRSAEIRELFKANPGIKAKEVIDKLGEKGIKVTSSLVYLVKGKMMGAKHRRRRMRRVAVKVAATSGNGDALSTIRKVKTLAAEVGGLRALKALVDALSE